MSYEIIILLLSIVALRLLIKRKPRWVLKGNIHGVSGRYTPVVITGKNRIAVYGNYNGTDAFEGIYMRKGGWNAVGEATLVFPNLSVTDQIGKPFIRTSAIAKG